MRKKKEEKITNQDIDDTVILDTNPLHAQLASSPLDIKAKQDEMVNALRRAGEQNDSLKRELMEERKRAAEELAQFERLVKQGLVQETEEDRLDDDSDTPPSSTSGGFIPRRTLTTSSKKGRGKGGMGDLLRGKTLSPGQALEQDRHNRANRPTMSRELGANPKLNAAYKESVSYQDDVQTGNPIFQAERSVFQEQIPQALKSMRTSLVSFGSAVVRRTTRESDLAKKNNATAPEEKSDD